MGGTQAIVRRASGAARAIGYAGATALGVLLLSLIFVVPLGALNDVLLIVAIGVLPVLMLAFWELGGLTPTPLALVAQVLGWLAAATWCVTHLLYVIGVVKIDYQAPAAAGALAVESVALVYIGLWIAGAALLAGPWLTAIRWLGVIVGVGLAIYGAGTIFNGVSGVHTLIGVLELLVLYPAWGFVMSAFLGRWARAGG